MIKKALFLSIFVFFMTGCTTPEKPKISQATQQAIAELQKGLYLYFDTGSSVVDSKYDIYFNTTAYLLSAQPNLLISVEGHADSRGSAGANQHLSLDRANAVKNKLISEYKVNPSQVVAIGFGAAEPAYDNETAEGRANNRRVKVRIYTK